MTTRDVYIEKMKTQLDELNASMATLQASAKEAKEEAKDKYKEEMANLRHQSDLAVSKLNDLKASTEDTWDNMVAEMDKIRDAFVHSFRYFKSQL